MTERIIFQQDKLFTLFDHHGLLHRNLAREEADELCTQAEINEARKQADFRQQPALSYDPETEMFFWGDDRDDQYDEDEVADDLAKIGWRPDHVPLLLELARSAARLERM